MCAEHEAVKRKVRESGSIRGSMLRLSSVSRLARPTLRRRILARQLSSEDSEDHYLEHWQRKQVKPHAYYEEQANRRHYFYTVDLQGRLFLEESRIKNITSCLKDNRFLDFFFSRVRPNDTGYHPGYPFISPCGKELNFILPADMPIVFHDMVPADGTPQLIYGGTRRVAFNPSALCMSARTHRLYHKRDAGSLKKDGVGLRVGLLRSHLALSLCERIRVNEDDSVEYESETGPIPIKMLAPEEEPIWGMPMALEE